MGFDLESNSGGDIADRELMLALSLLNVQVHVPLFGLRENNLHSRGVHFYPSRWKSTYGTGNVIPNIVYYSAIRKIHQRTRLDVLRVYSQNYGYCAFLVKKTLGIPIVWNYHHLENEFNERWQSSLFIREFDAITTVSNFTKQELLESYKLPSERVHVIPNGVSEYYSPHNPDRKLLMRHGIAGKRILLHVGSLIARKNLLFLLDVFLNVRRSFPDSVLLLCGEEFSPRKEYTSLLKRRVKELCLGDGVLFLGKISEAEKLSWYNLCEVFVFPSLKEGFGLAPAEAMSCGKPVVASNRSSLPEVVVNGTTGYVASPENAEEFASRVVDLLALPEKRNSFGRAGRKRVLECYQWSRAAKQTKALFDEMSRVRN